LGADPEYRWLVSVLRLEFMAKRTYEYDTQ